MAAVMVTARSVTISLNGAPKSSEAYEAGGRILAMIKSSKILTRQQSGDQKMVTAFLAYMHIHSRLCLKYNIAVMPSQAHYRRTGFKCVV